MIQLIGHNSKAIVDEKNKLIMMHTPRSGSTVAMKAFYLYILFNLHVSFYIIEPIIKIKLIKINIKKFLIV